MSFSTFFELPFSVHAPQHPKNAITRTTTPIMMKIIDEFRYWLPKKRQHLNAKERF